MANSAPEYQPVKGDASTNGLPDQRSWSWDAFFKDEVDESNIVLSKRGVPLNRFDADALPPTQSMTTGSGSARLVAANPLAEPLIVENGRNVQGRSLITEYDRKKLIQAEGERGAQYYWNRSMTYEIYVPPRVLRDPPDPLPLTLLFHADGPAMNRHGLRSVFEKSGQVLITIEGLELHAPIGISENYINHLIGCVLGLNKKGQLFRWKLDTLAAYSIGHLGLRASILQIFSEQQLSSVRKIVLFDCLYNDGGLTAQSIKKVVDANSHRNVEVVVYNVTNGTEDGTVPWPKGITLNEIRLVTDGKPKSTKISLLLLVVARCVQGGLLAGYFDRKYIVDRFGLGGATLMNVV